MASRFRFSILLSAAAIFFATGATASYAETIASVLDDTGADLLAATSPSLAVSLNEGNTITANVRLNRQPKSEVRISFSSSGYLELDVYNKPSVEGALTSSLGGKLIPYYSPPVLIFDSSNWNVPQAVSILSIEDGAADGSRTLPVRMSISTRGKATITNSIWINSLDSQMVTVPRQGIEPFISTGTLDKMLTGGTDNSLSRASDATALASYDGTKGTAKFLVTSSKLDIRNRVIEVDYTISAITETQNKVIVGQVRGINSRDLSLDMNYKPQETYVGSSGLSGVMTVRRRGLEDTFFVTSTAKDLSTFDINQYLGRWYEQGSAKKTGAAKLVNAKYMYNLPDAVNVGVEYAGNYGNVNGAILTATGVATPVRDIYSYSSYTQLNVLYTSWSTLRPPSGDYRIVDFSPDYSWAIASDSFGGNGVILHRLQVISEADYSGLLNRAKWLGVDTTKFTRTIQIAPPPP